jgi:type VI secretion system protein ImpL
MKRIFAFFLEPLVLALFALIILSLAVWFGGEYIRIGDSTEPLSAVTRLIIIMVLVVLWGLNNLRSKIQKSRQNDKMLDDISAPEKRNPKATDAANLAGGADDSEEKILYQRFKDATTALKAHRFGGSKRRTLYELPWYLIIGPPGAGKTTALANSGLNFPLKETFGLQGVGGVGGTRNCDWWFTDQAVLIDTAGRYTTQDSNAETDKAAWQGFLSLLKKHRPRRAINGVIVAVSMQELIMLSRDERQRHAETIRARIQELMSDLNVRFPVYLLITKCDLMAGFNEFFENLDQSDREQVLGLTFPFNENAAEHYAGFFETEFDALIRRINDRLLARLHGERDPYRRAKIQAYPNQFESMRDILRAFVDSVFGSNQYQNQPLLRGVYFTSGTQEGTPIDRILSSLSTHFGVQGKLLAPAPGQGKSFFIHRLLNEVIFPEANIVGVNKKYEIRLKLLRQLAMLSSLIVVLGAAAAWTGSLNKNEALMARVSELIAEHKTAVQASNDSENPFDQVIAIVEPLSKATAVYEEDNLPWLTGLGLYDESVQKSAEAAYQASLQAYFSPGLIKRLESFLMSSNDNDQLYDALRVYLMLHDSSKLEKNEVVQWFDDDWSKTLANQASKQKQLMAFLQDSIDKGVPGFELNQEVVMASRSQLSTIPVEQRIYKQIERNPEFRLQSDFAQAVGGDLLGVYEITNESKRLAVPFMFTKAGFGKMDFSQRSPLIRKYASEQWILGTTETEDFSDKDLELIAQKVEAIYLQKYIEKWQSLLEQLSIRAIANTGDSRKALAKMSDPTQSPLVKILTTLTNETLLRPQVNLLQDKSGALAEAATALTAKVLPPTRVDLAFSAEHKLINEKGLTPVLENMKALFDILEGFSFAPIPNEAALKFAQQRFSGAPSDPFISLLAQASKLPQPVKRWVEELADQAWKTVLADSKQHLNSLWNANVYQRYLSRIQGRYPFDKNAQLDATLLDFTEYFKPDGIEDSFVRNQLTPFIKKGKNWTEKSLNGRSLGMQSNALKQLQKAQEIRDVFFRKNNAVASFDYKLKPFKMDSSVRRFELTLGETSIRYSHGPKLSRSLSWPDGTAEGVRLLFEDINETKHNKRYAGDWSFFKALDDANVKRSNRSDTYIVTYEVNGRSAEYELTATSALNPFSPGWLNQYQCPKQL